MAFDIERFLSLSKAVETSDLDWDYIARVGVTDDEARILRYMADVETHTILYLRDLLAGHSARDYEVVTFLSCWVYEETHHGYALDRFLRGCGRGTDEARHYQSVTNTASWNEALEAFLSHAFAKATPHFAATHMTWGAINEMTAAMAYTALARYTRNTELQKLLLRMAKDERRHQSFYYHQAQKRLEGSKVAQAIASFALRRFWGPVGVGVGEDDTFGFIAALLFDNPEGLEEFRGVDRTVAKLPGLSWFTLVSERIPQTAAEFKRRHPDKARAIAAEQAERSRAA